MANPLNQLGKLVSKPVDALTDAVHRPNSVGRHRPMYPMNVVDAIRGKSLEDSVKGKVVMMNFFATWCGPCKFETPMFVQLQDQYRAQGVSFLGVQIQDDPALLKAFKDEYKVNYPLLVANDREDVEEAFGPFWGLPVTLMIGRDGTICKRHMGLASKVQMEKEIKNLL